MNRNTIWGTLSLSLLMILMGIAFQSETSSNQLSNSPLPRVAVANTIEANTEIKMSTVVDANNCFGFKLFQQLQSQTSNFVISPSSIAIALSMIRNGTGGETLEEVTKALELGSLDPQTVDASYLKLLESLTAEGDHSQAPPFQGGERVTTDDSEIEVAIANSLWANQNVTFKDLFISKAKEFYQAEVTSLDFSKSEAVDTINQWVASKTADKIPQIVDAVSPEDALYLLNAVYFKGNWTNQFDPKNTKEQPFYSQPDVPLQKAMMSQTGDYRYYNHEQFQAIRLPYGEKQELSMYIFLPNQNSSLGEFNQQLTMDNWQEWLRMMRSQPGNITLPRFKLEYETELKDTLAALGMKQIFDSSRADFSPMTDAPVVVDTVKHKTFIEVNEEGTEAAAVTSIGVRATSAMPQQPFEMNINRPFFFAIRDDITQTILFMGNIFEPN